MLLGDQGRNLERMVRSEEARVLTSLFVCWLIATSQSRNTVYTRHFPFHTYHLQKDMQHILLSPFTVANDSMLEVIVSISIQLSK
jgi:hypothetical protein